PIIGSLCRSVGTLFVDRRANRDLPRAIATIDRTLEAGQGVVLFPEGTSTSGEEVARFHPSLLEVAARARYPVSYASLGYATAEGGAPAHLAICWWGDMELPGHLWRLLALPGFRATVAFGDERIQEDDRKLLAARLWRAVNGLFTPVVSGAPESA
ncbi:MAG: lysophospholipid acyltransferase family protein, partial [Thermoanaerobaculia bacterium]